jgi:hypothetical protein
MADGGDYYAVGGAVGSQASLISNVTFYTKRHI